MDREPSESRLTARLLLAAGAIDLMFVQLVAAAMAPQVVRMVDIPAAVAAMGTFLVALQVYWLMCEVFLACRSIGRVCLGLRAVTRSREPLKLGDRLRRWIRKAGTFGLLGLHTDRLAVYDTKVGLVWLSGIGAQPRSNSRQRSKAIRTWRLRVETGPDAGQEVTIGATKGYKAQGIVKIGRDRGWADLVLENTPSVSRRHCTIRIRGDAVELLDHGTYGGGSKGRTILHGKSLSNARSTDIGSADHFKLADVMVSIRR